MIYFCAREADLLSDAAANNNNNNSNKNISPRDIISLPPSSPTITDPGDIGTLNNNNNNSSSTNKSSSTQVVEDLADRVIRLIPKWAEQVINPY